MSLRFASVGNDQRMKTWMITVFSTNGGGGASDARVKKVGDVYTGVADASSLDGYWEGDAGTEGEREEGEKWKLMVAGIGMEVWNLDGLNISRD